MARLPILEYPDPRLRIRAEPVTKFDSELKTLVADMFDTMYSAPGIGLAATQVNVHKRLLVCDVGVDGKQPYCLINPEIIRAEGKTNAEEGCLSVPEFYDFVDRAAAIRVRAFDRCHRARQIRARTRNSRRGGSKAAARPRLDTRPITSTSCRACAESQAIKMSPPPKRGLLFSRNAGYRHP